MKIFQEYITISRALYDINSFHAHLWPFYIPADLFFFAIPRAIFVYIISVWCFPSGIHNALSTIRYLVEIIPGTTKPNPSSLHTSFRIDIEPTAKCFIPQPAGLRITMLVKCPPILLYVKSCKIHRKILQLLYFYIHLLYKPVFFILIVQTRIL